MKTLKVVLVVMGVLFLVSAPGTVLPWSSVVGWAAIWGLQAPPDHPLVDYFVRMASLAFALIGIFLLVLATDPLRYRPMLVLTVCGCFAVAVVALAAGRLAEMPALWYLGDAVGCVVAAVLILAFWPREPQPTASP